MEGAPIDSRETVFKAAILADPTNVDLRLIYADWLDEADRPEDADAQRALVPQIRQAVLWIADLAAQMNQTLPDLMAATAVYLDTGEQTKDATWNFQDMDWPEFWKRYELLTGKVPSGEHYADPDMAYEFSPYTCPC